MHTELGAEILKFLELFRHILEQAIHKLGIADRPIGNQITDCLFVHLLGLMLPSLVRGEGLLDVLKSDLVRDVALGVLEPVYWENLWVLELTIRQKLAMFTEIMLLGLSVTHGLTQELLLMHAGKTLQLHEPEDVGHLVMNHERSDLTVIDVSEDVIARSCCLLLWAVPAGLIIPIH